MQGWKQKLFEATVLVFFEKLVERMSSFISDKEGRTSNYSKGDRKGDFSQTGRSASPSRSKNLAGHSQV
jgi:hypothetical protein